MNKLVSILTPCYNGDKYIARYAHSLLEQDYCNCQLIFMDDGSSDRTKERIFSYKEQFEEKGFTFEYHYHDNIGLGGTIAAGIKYVKGDYIIWPDVDDMLAPQSISKKVSFLEEHKEYGLVRSDYRKVPDNDVDKTIEIGPSFLSLEQKKKESLFEDYLVSRNMWLQPGCYMIRMSAFDDVNPDRYIFPTRRGQDWQMLLPVLYKYKCGYYPEPLYIYVIREGSLSNMITRSFESQVESMERFEELIHATLDHMTIPEKSRYKEMVTAYYLKCKFDLSYKSGRQKDAKSYYGELKGIKRNTIKQYLQSELMGNRIVMGFLRFRNRFFLRN